jgi:acetyltransferase-like isoleucine patch superfamily enzyme
MLLLNTGNSIANTYDIIKLKVISSICTVYMKIDLKFRGINYGKSIRFYGVAKFKRSNQGNIILGNNCTLHSKSTSNLIGVNHPCIFTALAPGSNLIIGDYCGFSGTVIGCFDMIKIGNNVRCGANTLITDSDWHLYDPRAGKPMPITIENNVWLGVNVTVLKGVRIGTNSVIGANSVVTKDIPSNVIAAGNPCKVIKKI